MSVVAHGRVTVFPRDGQYQLYVDALTPDGVGELYVAFEQLKEKLYQEGLFAQEHKRPIPRYPTVIALITSSAGAAVHDMIRILGCPLAHRRGEAAAGPGSGPRSLGRIGRSSALCQPVEPGRCHSHWPRRRLYRGSVGLQ